MLWYIFVWQNAVELELLQDQSVIIQDLRQRIRQQKSDFDTIQMHLHFLQETSAPKETVAQLEAKIRDLEGRMSLEVAARIRAEVLALTFLFL